MNDQKETTIDLADKYMFKTYARFPLILVRGDGCRVWDEDGKEYLDFVGGIAVCALGHSSPIVSKALENQSKELVHVSNLYYTRPQTELARLLVENSFADRVFFCNSGAEANEAAIKLARRYANEKFGPQRLNIISMEASFHGRTMATLSATGQKKVKSGYNPLLEGFTFVPFNDLESLDQALDESVCAVMLEPIQGEGGVVLPDSDYLKGVKALCQDREALLIFDEVQVGMGRTGKLFAHEHYGITPDIMTLAKALANGLPIGAMLAIEELSNAFGAGSHATTFGGTPLVTAVSKALANGLPIGAMLAIEELSNAFGAGSHATTFGGTPLVTAVSKAVVTSLLEDGWIDHCRVVGDYFKKRLEELAKKYDFIKEVRGQGLILGVEMMRPGAAVVKAMMEKGFLINCTQEKVLRFIPPLIVEKEEIDLLVEALENVLDLP